MPERIRLSRKKGWRMPPNAVRVVRPGRWGNPYPIGQVDGFYWTHGRPLTREESLQAARDWFEAHYLAEPERFDELRGKDLACWCKADEACHADILIDIANRERRPDQAEGK